LSRIARTDVERVVSQLSDAGRSKRTAAFTLFVIRAVLDEAVDEKVIASNPASRVKAIGKDAKERQALSSRDISTLRSHLSQDDLYACWLLTLFGLRRSEVMGLRWCDVDLARGTLNVVRGRVLVDGKRTVEGPPKTRRGQRSLPMPPDVISALKVLRYRQASQLGFEHIRIGYLAMDASGAPMRPERWTDLWEEHCKAAGVPSVTLHGARHSSVTAMRNAGVPDHLVAAWHGHDENIMRAVYSHSSEAGLAAAGSALSARMGSESDTQTEEGASAG
jgi:integrase